MEPLYKQRDSDPIGHAVALTRSRRAGTWAHMAWTVLGMAATGAVLPGVHWLAGRYDRESATRLTQRVAVQEHATGISAVYLPDGGVGSPSDNPRGSLNTRVTTLESQSQAMLQLKHDLLLVHVRVMAADTEREPRRRMEAADRAEERFEWRVQCHGSVGDAADPYRCARDPLDAIHDRQAGSVLETAVPRR